MSLSICYWVDLCSAGALLDQEAKRNRHLTQRVLKSALLFCPPKKIRPIIAGLVPILIGILKTRDDPGWLADTQLS